MQLFQSAVWGIKGYKMISKKLFSFERPVKKKKERLLERPHTELKAMFNNPETKGEKLNVLRTKTSS